MSYIDSCSDFLLLPFVGLHDVYLCNLCADCLSALPQSMSVGRECWLPLFKIKS